MILLDGKKTSNDIKDEIALEVNTLISNGGKKPHLAAILVGNNGASETYVNAKVKACNKVGFDSTLVRLSSFCFSLPLKGLLAIPLILKQITMV